MRRKEIPQPDVQKMLTVHANLSRNVNLKLHARRLLKRRNVNGAKINPDESPDYGVTLQQPRIDNVAALAELFVT